MYEIIVKGPGGQFVLLMLRILVLLIVIAGIRRFFNIRQDINDAVDSVHIDQRMPALLGARAYDPLLRKYHDPKTSPEDRAHILTALGFLAETGGLKERDRQEEMFKMLCEMLQVENIKDKSVWAVKARGEAAVTLAKIRHEDMATVHVLEKLLNSNPSTLVQEKIAEALGLLRKRNEAGDVIGNADTMAESAARVVLAKLKELVKNGTKSPNVLKLFVESIGLLLEKMPKERKSQEAIDLLLDESTGLLTKGYLRVQNRAATSLGRMADPRAAIPLLKRLSEPDLDPHRNPELRRAVGLALGRLDFSIDATNRDAAIDALLQVVTSQNEEENEDVKLDFARALAWLKVEGATRDQTLEALKSMLVEAVQDNRTGRIDKLLKVLREFDKKERREAKVLIKEIQERQAKDVESLAD